MDVNKRRQMLNDPETRLSEMGQRQINQADGKCQDRLTAPDGTLRIVTDPELRIESAKIAASMDEGGSLLDNAERVYQWIATGKQGELPSLLGDPKMKRRIQDYMAGALRSMVRKADAPAPVEASENSLAYAFPAVRLYDITDDTEYWWPTMSRQFLKDWLWAGGEINLAAQALLDDVLPVPKADHQEEAAP